MVSGKDEKLHTKQLTRALPSNLNCFSPGGRNSILGQSRRLLSLAHLVPLAQPRTLWTRQSSMDHAADTMLDPSAVSAYYRARPSESIQSTHICWATADTGQCCSATTQHQFQNKEGDKLSWSKRLIPLAMLRFEGVVLLACFSNRNEHSRTCKLRPLTNRTAPHRRALY